MKIKFYLLLFFLTNIILAQESGRIIINGKVEANTLDFEGVYVINLKTEKSTITGKEGLFSIAAIPGDSLLFSSLQLKEIRMVLQPKDFQEELFFVKMEYMITQLKEVVVRRYNNINAVSLGISPGGVKQLTQAERRLKTATGLNPTTGAEDMMAGGSVGFDPVLNLLSGRTAMLKKELEVENKISYMQLVEKMFNEDYFRKTLKIPAEYIKGFEYYIVDDDTFINILKSKNKTNIEFLMVELAAKYNEIIATENK